MRTYYYNCPVRRKDGEDRYRRQQKFFAALRNLPDFEIRLGHLQQDRSGALVEKGHTHFTYCQLELTYRQCSQTRHLPGRSACPRVVSDKGVYVLMLQEGARDFRSGAPY